MTKAQILARMRAMVDKAKAESRDFSDEENAEYRGLEGQLATITRDAALAAVETEEQRAAAAAAAAAANGGAGPDDNGQRSAPEPDDGVPGAHRRAAAGSGAPLPAASSPVIEVRGRRVENFLRYEGERSPQERAYRFGMWALAVSGNAKAKRYCEEQGIVLVRGQNEGVNASGGFLIPAEMDADIIDLREQYGVFRRNARISTMSGDTKQRLRRQGGLVAYFTGEAQAGTKSTVAWDMVDLIAKKVMVLGFTSAEFNEDSPIALADELVREVAIAFATKEDECGFNGDGTSTYGRIQGVLNRLTVTGTAGIKEAATGTTTNWGAITLANMGQLIAATPDIPGAVEKWYCSKAFWGTVMEPLANAAGGNTADMIRAGRNQKQFLGYPVETVPSLPKTADSAEIVCLFGDLRLAADFGDRTGSQIDFSTDAVIDGVSAFETHQTAMRAVMRFDINVHSVGSSTVAGPIVALKSKA